MRTIKFRGKCLNSGTWMYGDLVTTLTPKGSMTKCPAIHTTSGTIGTFFVSPNTVGQFTGLYDIRGSEICEGDILCVDSEHPNATIVWDKNNYGFSLLWFENAPQSSVCVAYLSCYTECKMKVIGNIYDNPELLATRQ